MAFNFGNTNQPTFGSAAAKPTAFGAPLSFTTPATTTSAGFGGFGSTFGAAGTQQQPTFGGTVTQQPTFGAPPGQQSAFGAPAAQQPAFGSTFGQPAVGATAPAFGSTFGQSSAAAPFGSTFGTPATSAPAFGSTFGASTTPSFFGSTATTKPSLFGAPTSSAPNLFSAPATSAPSLFGTATGTQAPNLFGTSTSTTPSLFGTTATTSAPNLFGAGGLSAAPGLFGASTATTAPSLFSGGTVTTSTPLFGSSFGAATTSAPNLFGGTGSAGFGLGAPGSLSTGAGTGFNLFGTTTTAPSLFSGFGTATNTSASGFSGFGTGTTAFPGFGGQVSSTTNLLGGTILGARPQAAAAVPAVFDQSQSTLASFFAINVFGDERDDILKKWNMLQACWGTGKGYYSSTQPPVEYNSTNPFYQFKAIGYVVIPERDSSDGLVKLIFNRKESELSNQRDVLVNGIGGILGNKPNLTVSIEQIKSVSDSQAEVMITVSEKGVTGSSRKIPSSDLSAFLNQALQKQQLANVGVNYIGPYMAPTKAQIEEYLKNPPPGIDLPLWQAAQAENPNCQKYLPTPINGFSDLKKRLLCEEYETGLHKAYLEKVTKDITELKQKHAVSTAQIAEMKQKFLVLQHRVLRILVKQEVTRKAGLALEPEEELLRSKLQTLEMHLNAPTQFKSLITEVLAHITLMGNREMNHNEHYKLDPGVQEDIRQFLKMEQNGIAHLINIINTDLSHLKIISEGMNQLMNKP